MPPIPTESIAPSALLSQVVPVLLLAGAALAGHRGLTAAVAWRRARWTSALALVSAAAAAVVSVVAGSSGRSFDLAGTTALLLVGFLGWIVVRYSQTYLDGERRQPTYVRWLLTTLAGASAVVATDHLGVLALAWLGTSLALQQLLTFYPDRPAALMAAHKKFLVSRLADLCLFTAVALFAWQFDTLHIGELVQRSMAAAPDGTLQAGAVLVVAAVLLKSAQLPFHGWLIQVMEAPTPVSALLHAGVVNLGGFALIRLGGLIGAVPVAQALLVVIGSLTAVLAALVTSTRISIKVALAWSTCAQMGFMLMQCGLGLYEMALLHLVAHSLYKAHCFLSAGGAVQRAIVRSMTPPAAAPSPLGLLAAAGGGVAMVALAAWLLQVGLAQQPALWALALIVSLALAPLLTPPIGDGRVTLVARHTLVAFVVAVAYFGLHRMLHGTLPIEGGAPPAALWMFAIACFALLYAAQGIVAVRPHGHLARTLYAWFYGGLFLDERFTRLTLRLWPIRQPASFDHLTLTPRAESPR